MTPARERGGALKIFFTALSSCGLLLAACQHGATTPAGANVSATPDPSARVNGTKGGDKLALKLTSAAFEEGGMIPAKYTCDGDNVSPPLAWSGVPESAKTLALVADDPDAPRGTWVHWVVYQIPATEKGLPENVPARETLDGGARQGKNDFKNTGYGGPCPPSGTHRYFFHLYALDAEPNPPSGVSKEQLLKAIEGHVVAEGQLMGRYQRSKQ
jgi:Raf kinase inhibitor-like YbhB/YbcL family protein